MLRFLHVTDLAIVRDVTLELGPGFNLLTGETGAGKSILVDALTLVLGGRAETGMIRSGSARASVEAAFEIEPGSPAARFLDEHAYPLEAGAIVARREILPQGKGRAFLGGALAPVADLRAFGALVTDLHGQHQQQTLLNAASHRELLDRDAGLGEKVAEMEAAAAALAAASTRLRSMREGAQRLAQRIDVLRFQVEEIDRAGVVPGEREALRAERDLLRNAETILRLCRSAHGALYEDEGSALGRLAEAIRAGRDLARFDAGIREAVERAEASRAELQEFAFLLRDYPSRLSFEPHRLEAIEERLQLIDSLLRKYVPDGGEHELQHVRDRAADELSQLTGGGESVEELENRLEELRARVLWIAAELSRRRSAAAQGLERRVEAELAELAMERTRFAVDFRLRPSPGSGLWVEGEEVAVDGAGYDVVEFLLSANRGERLAPLVSVASGGELSRLMLALEIVLRRDREARTLVFDEVDAGIGGAVAEAVGRRLKALSGRHQVVCVTHLPQIAACADRHVLVGKRPARGRTEVVVEVLDEAGAVRELARMLAGETITRAALRHAAEMRASGQPGPRREAGG